MLTIINDIHHHHPLTLTTLMQYIFDNGAVSGQSPAEPRRSSFSLHAVVIFDLRNGHNITTLPRLENNPTITRTVSIPPRTSGRQPVNGPEIQSSLVF